MKSLIPLITCLTLSCAANTQDYVRAGQYTEIKAVTSIEQLQPLKVIIDFSFPSDINNIGEALDLLLMPSGYAFDLKENDIAYVLFNMPLPEVHRKISMVTLEDAISVVSGSGFIPVYDHDLRQISFSTNSEKIKSIIIEPYKAAWFNQNTKKPINIIPLAPSNNNSQIEYIVKYGDSISKILLQQNIEYSENLVNQIIASNPHAFIDNDPNLLLQNVTIRLIK